MLTTALKSLFGFPLLFTVFIALTVYLPIEIYRASRPTTLGTVVASKRVWHVTTPSNGKGYPEAQILYEYSVNDRPYTSDRYDIHGPYNDEPFGRETPVSEVLAQYPVGTKVTVHYWSDDPAFSVLHPTMSAGKWSSYLLLNFGLGFILRLNWAYFRAGWRPWRRQGPWNIKAQLLGTVPAQQKG